jgi:hypothetical protein
MKEEDEGTPEFRDARVERFLKGSLDKNSGGDLGFVNAALVHTIQRASRSADRLSKRVFCLNVILVVLGSLGLIVAAYGVFGK